LVVGYLHTSPSSGRIQLVDQTGSIDCVVGAWPLATGESLATGHCCGLHDDCMAVNVSDGQANRCPFVQTFLLGRLFRIDHFQLVVETFQLPNDGKTVVVCPYIQFSAADLLQLCQRLLKDPFSSSELNRLHSPEDVNKRQRLTDNNHNNSTLPVTSTQVRHQNDSCDDLFASFVDSPGFKTPHLVTTDSFKVPNAVPVDRCQCFVSQILVLDSCENILLRSQYLDHLSLQFSVTGCFVGPPKLSSCGCAKSSRNSVPARLPLTRLVAILFSSRSVRWFPVLHPGCVYRLILTSNDVSPFLGKCKLPHTNKTKLERHAARTLVSLDTDICIDRMTVASLGSGDLLLSAEEKTAISAAVEDVQEQLKCSDGFWQECAQAASVRYANNLVMRLSALYCTSCPSLFVILYFTSFLLFRITWHSFV